MRLTLEECWFLEDLPFKPEKRETFQYGRIYNIPGIGIYGGNGYHEFLYSHENVESVLSDFDLWQGVTYLPYSDLLVAYLKTLVVKI